MPAKSTARSSSRKASTKRSAAKSTTRKTPARKTPARKTAARKTASRKPTSARSRSGSGGRSSARSSQRGRANPLKQAAQEIMEMMEQQTPPSDAVELLEQDHRMVEAMFEEFESLEEDSEKQELAMKICAALTVHAEIEEAIFYPRARKSMDEGDLVDEAEVEHASAKQLIAEIMAMKPREKLFDAKVKVLGEYIKHHVKEEENEMFPKVREGGMDLENVGKKLLQQKTAMLEELSGGR